MTYIASTELNINFSQLFSEEEISELQHYQTLIFFLCKHFQVVSDARVPIIKLEDKEKSFKTDISVENWANVRNAFLLKCYSECDPRVKPLVITIKLWAQKAEITDAKLHRLSGNASRCFYSHRTAKIIQFS